MQFILRVGRGGKVAGNSSQEADRMKADIRTQALVVAHLEEAEGVACEIEVYKSSCIELKNAVDVHRHHHISQGAD